MGLDDESENNESPILAEYERLASLGDDPDAWRDLTNDDLKQVVMLKCFQYGLSQDGSRIPMLFALHREVMERLDVPDRLEMLAEVSSEVEKKNGRGHMGLMMFLAADNDPVVNSTAALNLSVLFDSSGGNFLDGPSFVVRTLIDNESNPESQGSGLGGVLLLGDKRVMPLLEHAWKQLSDESRLAMTMTKSGFVTEGIVEFWLSCLENGCSESVFGSVVAAIAKMPSIAQVPMVLDVERLFPAYAGGEPLSFLRQTSFTDFLEEIRPRLEALEEAESEPKLIPKIYEFWDRP